jgi:hypothetical protein
VTADRITPNNKPGIIISDNEKEACLLIMVKLPVTSHGDSGREWNVGLPSLL